MKKYARWLILAGGILVAFIPVFTKNHIYNQIYYGEDTKVFARWITEVANGTNPLDLAATYFGQNLIFGFLGLINRVIHVNPTGLFTIFIFCVLVGVGVSLYWFGRILGGERTGWLTLTIGMLSTTAILGLFSYGIAIGILNMYVILPWMIICGVKAQTQYKWHWLVLLMVFCTMMAALHASGLYVVAALAVYGIMWNRQSKYAAIIGVGILIPMALFNTDLKWITWERPDLALYPAYFWGFIRDFLGIPTTILGLITFIGLAKTKLNLTPRMRYGLMMVGSLAVVLSIGSILRVTQWPERIMLDLASIMAILIALFFGEILKTRKWQLAYIPIALGGFMTLGSWVR